MPDGTRERAYFPQLRLGRAEGGLRSEDRGNRIILGTAWYMRTHGSGVDVYKTLDTGGIDFDFDFDKPHPG